MERKIWISSLCVSVNIINFALNFDCSQQGICVKIRLYRITSIMIQNPAKNKKKNSDSHKPQRQYVPEHEQKDPEQLNVGIQWKLRVVRLHLGSFFWTTMTWNLSTSIWRFHIPQYYSKIKKTGRKESLVVTESSSRPSYKLLHVQTCQHVKLEQNHTPSCVFQLDVGKSTTG